MCYLYGIGLIMLDRFPTPQCLGQGKLSGGRVFLFFSILFQDRDVLSLCHLIRLSLCSPPRVPLWVLRRLLFFLLLLFLLRVSVGFSLAVLSQLHSEQKKKQAFKQQFLNEYVVKLKHMSHKIQKQNHINPLWNCIVWRYPSETLCCSTECPVPSSSLCPYDPPHASCCARR